MKHFRGKKLHLLDIQLYILTFSVIFMILLLKSLLTLSV